MEKEERKKRTEERVIDVRVYGCPRSTHIYGYTYADVYTLPGRCTDRPTAMLLDAFSWKLTYSELMLFLFLKLACTYA